jgi:hypothetical protein
VVPFAVYIWGRLIEASGGVLNGKTVNLYNADASGNPVGNPIASMITGVLGAGSPGGDYSFPVTITAVGTYYFVTEFPGDAIYEGCEKVGETVGTGETQPPDYTLLIVAGGVTAAALIGWKLLKR